MNKIKITLKEDGSVEQFTPDFKIMRGSYRNVLINIEVPYSLLLNPVTDLDDNSNRTGNNVRIGAIIRTATGQNLQTQRYEFQRVKDYTNNGIAYRLYQRRMPKEFTMWETVNLLEATNSGVLEMVINVTNWVMNGTTAKIEEVAASPIFELSIYPSAFLENAEEIDEPSDFDELQSQVQEIDAELEATNTDLYGTDTNTLGTYLSTRLKAGNKITIEEDTTLAPNNQLKISVQTINANEIPINAITDINATDVQGALEILSSRSDAASIDTVSGETDDLVDNTDPKNPIIMHDIIKANLVVGATVDNLAKLTSSGNLADSGSKISDLVLKTDIIDNLSSTANDKPLSANQGNALKALVDNKEDSLGFTPENSANKNTNNGYCPLDSVAKVPLANLPTIPTKDSDLTNDSYVRYDSDGQGLTDTQKANARSNIGAGDSGFSGNYNDLSNKPNLQPHATTNPSTAQGTGITTVPSDQLLTNSSYARVYKGFSDLGISEATATPADFRTAMVDNSIFMAQVSPTTATGLAIPTTFSSLACYLNVHRIGSNSIEFTVIQKAANSTASITLFGAYRGTDTSNNFSGWKQLATTDNPTFTGIVTVPTPVNDTDAATKQYADSVITGAQTIGGAKTFTGKLTVSNSDQEIVVQHTSDIYTIPPSGLQVYGFECQDKNGHLTGGFKMYHHTDGAMNTAMVVRSPYNGASKVIGLRADVNGTYRFSTIDSDKDVDLGSSSFPFKDLYLAGNINAAGTIKGNVENSPYKLIASGTLAAGASLALDSLILNVDQAGRPFYMRIWGTTDNVYAVFKSGGYTANHIVTNLFSETYSATISTTNATEQLFQGGKTSYSGVATEGNNNYCGGMIELQINRMSEYRDDEYSFYTLFTAIQTQFASRTIQTINSDSSYTMLNTGTSTLNYQLYSANY